MYFRNRDGLLRMVWCGPCGVDRVVYQAEEWHRNYGVVGMVNMVWYLPNQIE